MDLTMYAKEIHSGNKAKGFYDKPVETGTTLMLITSELSEALEADRHNLRANRLSFEEDLANGMDFKEAFKKNIKDSYEDEIADAIIRLLDHCGFKRIDIDFHVKNKIKYNSTRGKLHGKKY
jgi:NTP pyrophosphatase (non-canonical NTP hydrolase)